MPQSQFYPTSSHWGNYKVEVRNGAIHAIHPYPADPHPTPIGQSLANALDPGCRIAQPMVRKGYLRNRENSDGANRGVEPFVPVSWDDAVSLAAGAIDRVRQESGNSAIYGGSYGWSSAGRFHHAQSQVHRFLNATGGYTRSINSYSAAAAEVITPHTLGMPFHELMIQAPTVQDMKQHTGLVVSFGGIAMKNTQIMSGGLGAHTAHDQLGSLKESGIDFVNVSPIRDDMSESLSAQWVPCRPNSDVAIMLSIAHTLVTEGLHDQGFLDRYCEGFSQFLPYLLGQSDGQPKDVHWAARLSDIPAEQILALARRMAATRTVIGISWSLQRAEHGEQTYWMATTLGALLGSHGQPGGGVAYGYGSVHNIGFGGRRIPNFSIGALPQGRNAVEAYIPVARISDMLLNPGGHCHYNGKHLQYPNVRLIYWAGGNPFHHHQDLNRLRNAWTRPETIIVNEPFWTAAARHADIVFPCTTPLERNDLGAGPWDCYMTPMRKAVEPFEQARNDYDVFTQLSAALGCLDTFTEGRSEMDWVRHLYGQTKSNAKASGVELPDFNQFWEGEQFSIENQLPDRAFRLERFREDPDANPMQTPSGKIEIFSSHIQGLGYDDCGPHPTWYDKTEWLGSETANRYPLHLLSNQPKTKLHSQYDHGVTSREAKIQGREILRLHPLDAAVRSIKDKEIVRVYNSRGACLAAAVISDAVRTGVVELPTGAWYDPAEPGAPGSIDIHGNPNVLTRDVGTSQLGQGPTAHSCLVEVEAFTGELPAIKIFDPPPTQSI